MPRKTRKTLPDRKRRVRAIARERVGTVKPSRAIEPKKSRKPKHKRPPGERESE
jgi:hypothetical protein